MSDVKNSFVFFPCSDVSQKEKNLKSICDELSVSIISF